MIPNTVLEWILLYITEAIVLWIIIDPQSLLGND